MPGHPRPLALAPAAAPVALPVALAGRFFPGRPARGGCSGRGTVPLPGFPVMPARVLLAVAAVVAGAEAGRRLIAGPVFAPMRLPLVPTGTGAAIRAWRCRHDPAEAEVIDAIGRAPARADEIGAEPEQFDEDECPPDGEDRR